MQNKQTDAGEAHGQALRVFPKPGDHNEKKNWEKKHENKEQGKTKHEAPMSVIL